MERLSRYSAGLKSPMSAIIHQYLITQNKREQKSKGAETKSLVRTVDKDSFVAGKDY